MSTHKYDLSQLLTVLLFGFLLGLFVAGECLVSTIKDMRTKAVKAGAAEWLTNERGETTFSWKVDKK